jgi:hypothetical protein
MTPIISASGMSPFVHVSFVAFQRGLSLDFVSQHLPVEMTGVQKFAQATRLRALPAPGSYDDQFIYRSLVCWLV